MPIPDPERVDQIVQLADEEIDRPELGTAVREVTAAPIPELVVVDHRAAAAREIRHRQEVVVGRPGAAMQQDERRRRGVRTDLAGDAKPRLGAFAVHVEPHLALADPTWRCAHRATLHPDVRVRRTRRPVGRALEDQALPERAAPVVGGVEVVRAGELEHPCGRVDVAAERDPAESKPRVHAPEAEPDPPCPSGDRDGDTVTSVGAGCRHQGVGVRVAAQDPVHHHVVGDRGPVGVLGVVGDVALHAGVQAVLRDE